MEEIAVLLIPALTGILLVRSLLLPIRAVWKIAIHCISGFLCLWLLNTAAPFTGIVFPLNAVTVSAAGILGLPGIALMAALAVMG